MCSLIRCWHTGIAHVLIIRFCHTAGVLIYPILLYRPCAHLFDFGISPMCSFAGIHTNCAPHQRTLSQATCSTPPSTHRPPERPLHAWNRRATTGFLLSAHTAHTRHMAHGLDPSPSLPFPLVVACYVHPLCTYQQPPQVSVHQHNRPSLQLSSGNMG